MPLKLKLGAHERLIVNGAVMVNGGCRTTLIIRISPRSCAKKTSCRSRTPTPQPGDSISLCRPMLMQPPPSAELTSSYRLAHTQLASAYVRDENLEVLREVDRLVGLGDCYKALMRLHPLIAYEADLLNVPQHEWRRSSHRAPASLASGRPRRHPRYASRRPLFPRRPGVPPSSVAPPPVSLPPLSLSRHRGADKELSVMAG